MGLEEVTAYFHLGLAESVRANRLSRRGIATSISLNPQRPLVVNYITAVAEIPVGFDRVASIYASGDGVRLISRSGKRKQVPLDLSFLRARAD
jgi:hypothetical protein